ncbi:MAG: hypothetical protein ACREOG_03580, partial [Gemmatimonadaceae bacterium]
MKYHVLRFADERHATEVTLRLLELVERALGNGERGPDGVVVWTSSPWAADRELYLSDAALRLAEQSRLGLEVDRE